MGDVLEIARERERRPLPVAPEGTKKRIVIVGAGFAGLAAAQALRKCDAEVILIDRRNHHIFQPLLYQVATAVLASSEIAAPILCVNGSKRVSSSTRLSSVSLYT